MQTLDPYSIPLESINLIEASAGTGKSWTVTLLYLRLILEKKLTVDQILVVTFTEAATKELRDDIRNRLVAALTAFKDADYQEDDEYLRLIKNTPDREQAIHSLNRAKLSLDEAAIFTIHGFCQRTLNENAFEAGLPFESELMDDDSELMQKLTDDFWRRRFSGASAKNAAPRSLIFKLQQRSVTPDSLLKDIRNAVGKPYLTLCGPDSEEIKAEKWTELDNTFTNILQMWNTEGEQVTEILLEDKGLNRRLFKLTLVEKACKDMGKLTSLYDVNESLIKQFEKFKRSYIESGIKAKHSAPEHAFFAAWENFSDLWVQLNKGSDDFLNNIRIELLQHLQQQLPKEKIRLGVLSFDDLLLQLQKALTSHPQLASLLRKKYQAALIDEFQDTDPIQYDIFSSIYKESKENAVFLVGDPKQAIYSFRGGDIHTYLKAKAETNEKNHYTLKTNWRSHPKLISAFNSLYGEANNPFQDEGIDYVEVKSGKELKDLKTPKPRSPLQFWRFTQTPTINAAGKSVPMNVEAIRQQIATAVAGDIAELLNAANQGEAKIAGEPINGGDIAILIRAHRQGDLIKAALNQRKIASVQSSKQSIFETHEAVEMRRLLNAIVNPQLEDEIRRALVTELMGYQANDLLQLENDSNAWEDILLLFQNWHYQWKQQGFLPMMRALMKSQKTHQHLLAYADGERRLTNTLHLSEIIHQSVRKNSLSMEEVLRWLKKQQENGGSAENELRLESDENLVKIVTIHKSKGLEYPIVYCPFIGITGSFNKDKVFTFHKDKQSFLEIGSPDSEDHKALKIEEEKAEDTRLLYVALTRAKYQCNVVVFPEAIYGSPDRSALGWLLSNGKVIPSGNSNAAKEQKAEFFAAYDQNLNKLVAKSAGNIWLDDLPEYPENLQYQAIETDQTLSAREFKAEIKLQAQITSFSGLTAGAHAETPDYDTFIENQLLQASQIQLNQPTAEEFPRGATAGTALHEIYENLDFVKPVAEQMEVIDAVLDKYGFDNKHQTTATRLIEDSLQAELSTGLSLNKLSDQQRLNEMEFYLPLERLDFDHLKQIMFQHLPKGTDWQLIRDAVDTLYFDEVEGYLKGFIDLIFEHDGKYYLADYKSNSLSDYTPAKLFEPMAEAHYYLQYLLYSVALHRYLEQRIADYSWETHIGGAYYLFIRGMSPVEKSAQPSDSETTLEHSDDDPKGEMKSSKKVGGVFFHKPSLELIEALDGLFIRLPQNVTAQAAN